MLLLQWFIYTASSLLVVPNAVLILLLVFALGSPVADKAWACTSDTDHSCMALLSSPDKAAVQAGFCSMSSSQWYWTKPGDKLVSRFNLVCGDAFKAQIANSFFFVGYLIGSGSFGVLSDIYGRKASAFGATLLAAVFTAGAAGVTNYWGLLILRLLTGGTVLCACCVCGRCACVVASCVACLTMRVVLVSSVNAGSRYAQISVPLHTLWSIKTLIALPTLHVPATEAAGCCSSHPSLCTSLRSCLNSSPSSPSAGNILTMLAGIGVAGQALGAYLLATEMLGPTWRGSAGILTQVGMTCGLYHHG